MILGIYGTGGMGRDVRYMVESCPSLNDAWEKIIFIDDTKPEGVFDGIEVYPLNSAVEKFKAENIKVCVAVGEPRVKEILWNKIRSAGVQPVSIIHPEAFISPDAFLGDGVIARKGVIVSSKARIGSNTSLMAYSVIGHDVEIGDGCQVSTFVTIGGCAKVGAHTYLGLSVAVRDRVTIGDACIISMGAVVQKDIEDGMIAMGNPARPIRKNVKNSVFV